MGIDLSIVTKKFDSFFEVDRLPADPSMKNFVPSAYNNYPLAIEKIFQKEFLKRFNGLMIMGNHTVHSIFTAAFPHDEILSQFIEQSQSGDLLFIHHPIRLECGDPQGMLGRGFLPINPKYLREIVKRRLSIYSLHAPLDYHPNISTNRAIVNALSADVVSEFLPYGNGNAGLVVTISEISTNELIDKLKIIFSIPYVDFDGVKISNINTIGIVAGGGDDVEYFKECADRGCQAYLSGEITSRQISKWAQANMIEVSHYTKTSRMSLIGVSHAASEFLVMKSLIPEWIRKNFNVSVVPLAQDRWWV